MNLIKEIEQEITERTVELSQAEYIEFLRELAMRCEDKANMLEYMPEYNSDEE